MAVVQDNKATRIISIPEAGVDIVAHTYCRRVRVQENFSSSGGPTTDLSMAEPKGATAVIVLKGTPAVFTGGGSGPNGSFYPGQVVGRVASASGGGTVAGQQIEDQLV